jgi:hypothetical protein
MLKFQLGAVLAAAALSSALVACGGGNDNAAKENANAAAKTAAGEAAPAKESATVATLAQGPDVCVRAISKHLGAETKIAEMTSYFSSGSVIESSDDEPQGQMTTCSVQYQSPDDPRKLVGISMDVDTGEFGPPSPVEITVMGNAAEFNLEDHIVPLSTLNAAGLTAIMDAQKAKIGSKFSGFAWTGVRLMGPSAFNAKHTLRLDLTGRLASNDIKHNGYASISLDGKTITADHLMP